MAAHTGKEKMNSHAFSYDKEQDDLLIYDANQKSSGSVEIGDIIIDFNSEKDIVGVEFLNASEIISTILKIESKEILDSLVSCKLDITKRNNMSIISLTLKTENNEFTPTISIPTISEKSPALKI